MIKTSSIVIKQLVTLLLIFVASLAFSATYNVTTSEELLTALNDAVAGDEILLASGSYTTLTTTEAFPTADGGAFNKTFYFKGGNDGTKAAPITIKSANASDPAILAGSGPENSGYVLFITGDYWVIENIKIESGAKGVILDNSNYTTIKDVEIYNIGQEAIHVRDGSSNTLIDSVNVHDIGTRNDGFGEGIYIGSDNSVWWEGDEVNTGGNGLLYKRACNNTTVINSTVGPNITAEPIEIKEGVENTVVENCVVYGSGVSGVNFADSLIDIKGNTSKIRCNTFYQNENTIIARSINIVQRTTAGVDEELNTNDNIIHENTFYLDDEDVWVVLANSGSGATYAWDNVRIPEEGNLYNNSRVSQVIPDAYSYECDNSTLSNDSFEKLGDNVKIFPNPFNNQIQLNFGDQSVKYIKVFDQLGRLVEQYNEGQIQADIQIGKKLNGGIYYVKISTGKGTKTVVINKF